MAKFLRATVNQDGKHILEFDSSPTPDEVISECKRRGIPCGGQEMDGGLAVFLPKMAGKSPIFQQVRPARVIISPPAP